MKKTTERVRLLENDRSFRNFFKISCMSPDDIAAEVVDSDFNVRYITYREFRSESLKASAFFKKKFSAVEKGSFVAIVMDNSYQYPYVFWGLVMAGFNPILLDFRVDSDNLKKYLQETGAAILVSDRDLSAFCNNVEFLHIDDFVLEQEDSAYLFGQWGNKIVFCTSGTTGDSRIFVFDEKNFVTNLFLTWKTCEHSPYVMPDTQIKYLAFLPVFHIYGFYVYYGCTHLSGKTVVYMPDRKPETLLRISQERGITHMPCVPLLFKNLVNKVMNKVNNEKLPKRAVFHSLMGLSRLIQRVAPVSGQRFVYKKLFGSIHKNIFGSSLIATQTAGAYMPPEVNKILLSLGFPMYTGLGTTETIIVSIDYGRSFSKKLKSSMGIPFEESKIVDLKTGKESSEGVLYVRGDSVHSWRLKDGELIPADKDEDGWYCTNDIVRKDRKGNIYFLSRSKDVIIPATGENIYPDQLEAEFGDFQGIKGKLIVGVETSPGAEEVYMVLEPDSIIPDYSEIFKSIKKTNKRLPVHQNIFKVYISEKPFPVTNSLKVQRQKMKQMIEKNKWPMTHISELVNSTISSSDQSQIIEKENNQKRIELTKRISRVFADVLGKQEKDISPTAHFIVELGGDSLTALQLASELEKNFDIFVNEEILRENVCVNDYVNLIMNGPAKASHEAKVECEPVTAFTDSREFAAFATRVRSTTYNPYFIPHDSAVSDTSIVAGNEVLNFASYNYLGLSGNPDVVKFTTDAVQQYGTSASGSRVLTGEKTLYRTLEKELAEWKGTEDSIVLVSGNATNTTFVGNFCGKRDLIVYDLLSHDSISQGIRLSRSESRAFAHNDYKELDEILSRVRKYYEKVLIIIEGVYSMDGDIAPVPEFVKLKKKYGAFLMVDEAHSTGILGPNGKGVCDYFGLEKGDVDIFMGTLSKSLGSCGGYLAGDSSIINFLRYNLPGFVFSVGIPPASAAAALAGIRVLSASNSQVEKLHENITEFFKTAVKYNLNTCDADFTAIIPVLVGDDNNANILCKEMLEEGVFIVPAVYPAVAKGQARLRFCVTSEHKPEQIETALLTLRKIADRLGIKLPESESRIPEPIYRKSIAEQSV